MIEEEEVHLSGKFHLARMEGAGLVLLVLLIAVITGGDHLGGTMAWQSVAPLIFFEGLSARVSLL